METAEKNVDIKKLFDAITATENSVLKEGFISLVQEVMTLRQELMEERGVNFALLHEKSVNYKNLIKKQLEEEKGVRVRR